MKAPRGPRPGDALAAALFPTLPTEVQWGLERTRSLLAAVGDPLSRTAILHVGGTNGKGSVARIWASVLQAAGFRVGLCTSPELIAFRERILVNGSPLPDTFLLELAQELREPVIRAKPSWFEACTVLGFLALDRARVDVAVMEVGMGGRLDSTNVVNPLVTAITNVSLDHQEVLGPTVRHIAREKAGILKEGVPAFTGVQDPDVLEVLASEAGTVGAPLMRVPAPQGTVSLDGIRTSLRTRTWGVVDLHCPLVGRHQLANLAVAVRALEALPPRYLASVGQLKKGVSQVRAPGRFQVEETADGLWILDVAHNPAAAAALAGTLGEVDPPGPVIAVLGIRADKDRAGIVEILAGAVDGVVLTRPGPTGDWSGSWSREGGAPLAPEGAEVRTEPDFPLALASAREWAGADGTVVVSGSFSTVAGALEKLGRIPREALPASFASG